MSLSRSTGKFKLVENGVKNAERYYEELVEWMKAMIIYRMVIVEGRYTMARSSSLGANLFIG